METGIALQFITGLGSLVIGGDLLVRGASSISLRLGIPPLIIGLTVVALGTSFPELAVSLQAALKNSADLSVANVVGSNIFNILFILGVTALISPLIVKVEILSREVPIMVGASVLLLILGINGNISRFEGAVLFLSVLAYTAWLVIRTVKEKQAPETASNSPVSTNYILPILFILGGLGLTIFGADWLVLSSIELARAAGISETVIGLTIVAAGTSLPEVAASVMATIKGEREIAVGNVVGSNIYNVLAILGLTSIVVPNGLMISAQMLKIEIPIMIATGVLCWLFFLSGKRLVRWEGAFMLGTYIAYVGYLIFAG